MSHPVAQLVAKIHASATRLVIAVAGGGSRAISELAQVPGASRTLLEAVVPYSAAAMVRWLGGPPVGACSAQTARAMAMAAYLRACDLAEAAAMPAMPQHPPSTKPGHAGVSLAGIAATASLASERPKRGDHRVHLAIQTASETLSKSLTLSKGRRSRRQEERLVGRLLLNGVAETCGLSERIEVGLLDDERLEERATAAPRPWQDLLANRVRAVRLGGPPQPAGTRPGLIFPGAFNPLHAGHRRMAQVAQAMLQQQVELEISIDNVDKPPIDFFEIQERTDRIGPEWSVWLTRSAKFAEKSVQFPGATFMVGTDTLRRIADPHYYADDPAACRQAIERIAAQGCHFLVFGRVAEERFETLTDLDLPEKLASICREVPSQRFREDVSSREIRRQQRS